MTMPGATCSAAVTTKGLLPTSGVMTGGEPLDGMITHGVASRDGDGIPSGLNHGGAGRVGAPRGLQPRALLAAVARKIMAANMTPAMGALLAEDEKT